MTELEFKEMKDGYMDFVTKMLVETGDIEPCITVMGKHLDDDKEALVHIPIPSKYMKSEDRKDEFVDTVIPEIAKKLKDMFSISVVAWAAEAWMRVTEQSESSTEEQLKNWKSIPISKEVLIISFDSAETNRTIIMEIKRNGKVVNSEGELIDDIKLLDIPEFTNSENKEVVEGRFSNLYKKFTEEL